MSTTKTKPASTATTITSPDDLGELPGLIPGSMPAGLGELGAPWDDLLAQRDDRLSRAKRARRAYDRAVASLDDAKRADGRATIIAVRDGNGAPAPDHALAALAEIERLHREADAATRLANDTALELKRAVNSEAGDQAVAALDRQADEQREEIAATIAILDGQLTALGTTLAVSATIPATRKTHGVLAGRARRGHDGIPPMAMQGGGLVMPARDLLDVLRRIANGEDRR